MNAPASIDPAGIPRKNRLLRSWKLYLSLAAVSAAIVGLAIEAIMTKPIRDALNVYMSLITVANRPDYDDAQRVAAARELCSEGYLKTHDLQVAPQGGLIGIPRNVNKNFKAWSEGDNIWICPTNRIGPIFQFVSENGRWKFDGPVGLLRPRGEIIRTRELQGLEAE